MQLEQQESFEIKGPQLEVFGEAETRLPAAAKSAPPPWPCWPWRSWRRCWASAAHS